MPERSSRAFRTAAAGARQQYDFDSFRLFIWSLRRHRYETAYIERNLKGYAPVLLQDVDFANGKQPGFSVCVEKKDGPRTRREYAVLGNAVRFAGFFGRRFRVLPGLPVIYRDLGSRIPSAKLRFTFGDLDNF